MKPRVYIETSVWNFHFADDSPERRDVTKKFFDEVREGRHDVYLSNLVFDELRDAPEPQRSQLLKLVDEVSPGVLLNSDEAVDVSRQYLKAGMIPAKYEDDAAHIAIAVVNGMDVLLSWNFKHIVKLKTRRLVSATSRLLGYKEIDICTPEEMDDDR